MHPSLIKVTAADHYKILIEFDNHEIKELDMTPYLNFEVFTCLQKPKVFHSVRVSFDTVAWLNELDLDPDFIYEKSIKQNHLANSL